MKKISISVTTKSNLFIGGTPTTFEIGGIDQYTVTDYQNNPYIPGSSLKGTIRNIVRELSSDAITAPLNQLYQAYCKTLCQEAEGSLPHKMDADTKKRLDKRMKAMEKKSSAEYLFGIEGFNQTPKLLFSDLKMVEAKDGMIFSIDSKNSIKEEDNNLSAIPRIYKTVAPNVVFQGEILFQNPKKMEKPDLFIQEAENLLKECFALLTSGYYRLGNSGSRGYGRVEIKVEEHLHGSN